MTQMHSVMFFHGNRKFSNGYAYTIRSRLVKKLKTFASEHNIYY